MGSVLPWNGEQAEVGKRIVVVGTTGSGKTTMAQRLASLLHIPHVELDAIHWEPGWQKPHRDLFRERVSTALSGDTWVADGNYGDVRDIVWARADTLVWLDFTLRLSLWRLTLRTAQRVGRREELWNTNRETWRGAFFSRDSLFLYAVSTHRRRRYLYLDLLAGPDYAHLIKVRLSSPRLARKWLQALRHIPMTTV